MEVNKELNEIVNPPKTVLVVWDIQNMLIGCQMCLIN